MYNLGSLVPEHLFMCLLEFYISPLKVALANNMLEGPYTPICLALCGKIFMTLFEKERKKEKSTEGFRMYLILVRSWVVLLEER